MSAAQRSVCSYDPPYPDVIRIIIFRVHQSHWTQPYGHPRCHGAFSKISYLLHRNGLLTERVHRQEQIIDPAVRELPDDLFYTIFFSYNNALRTRLTIYLIIGTLYNPL